MLPGLFDGSLARLQDNVSGSTTIQELVNAMLGGAAPNGANLFGADSGGASGGFQSGFRPPPQGGFNLTPPQNYWQGGNFMAPGVSGSPLMTSDMANRFPGLGNVLGGGNPMPPPAAPTPPQANLNQGGQLDWRSILSGLKDSEQGQGLLSKAKGGGFDKMLGGALGLLPGLMGGKGGAEKWMFGLLPGLLSGD